LAEASDVILVSVADEEALQEVYLGADGVLAAALDGKIIVEMSTVRPVFVSSIATRVTASRGHLVDAPVLGTVARANEGQLVVVAGGNSAILERLRPILSVLGRRVMHMGPVGSGAAMKLVINMQLATYWQMLGESLSLGQRSGLDLRAMLDVIGESAIATSALAAKRPALLRESREFAFNIAGIFKDLSYAISVAERCNTRSHVAAAALDGYRHAVESGLGQMDFAEAVTFILRGENRWDP
jgi:3-hydroxyisobutyrate dehydrogenase-like beta-hydroxyacid dehydrogenase